MDELQESEERLELALAGADLGTWDWDVQSGEVRMNARWAEMLGYAPDELEPHHNTWKMLVHPDDWSEVTEVLNAHLENRTDSYVEHRLRHKSGRWIWVLSRGKVISRDATGRPLRACGTNLDITDRKEHEERDRIMQKRMEQAQRLESLGVLAGGIAHDFNNLLMGILGHADLILEDLSPISPVSADVAAIKQTTLRAADLCAQMLAYAGKGSIASSSTSPCQ